MYAETKTQPLLLPPTYLSSAYTCFHWPIFFCQYEAWNHPAAYLGGKRMDGASL